MKEIRIKQDNIEGALKVSNTIMSAIRDENKQSLEVSKAEVETVKNENAKELGFTRTEWDEVRKQVESARTILSVDDNDQRSIITNMKMGLSPRELQIQEIDKKLIKMRKARLER